MKKFRVKEKPVNQQSFPCREREVPTAVNIIMETTTPDIRFRSLTSEEEAEKYLLYALFYYVLYKCKNHPELQTMETMKTLLSIRGMPVSLVDQLFGDLEEKEKNNPAAEYYKRFCVKAGNSKTAVMTSALIRLTSFGLE